MSKYQDWLIQYITNNPDFIKPDFHRNETLGFLKQPLTDRCISRPKSRITWGIELPFNKEYVCYVWFEALINYISAIGFNADQDKFNELWPADYHIIDKDILTTHIAYWPTILKAIGLKLPKTIFSHGCWLVDGQKMSKSKGNVIDPLNLINEFGTDATHYSVLSEMTAGQDASYTKTRFIERYNSDLANNLGNLTNRVLLLIKSTCAGKIPVQHNLFDIDNELHNHLLTIINDLEKTIFDLKINTVIEIIISAIKLCNRYLEKTEPWKLKKNKTQRERVETVLYTALEAIRIISGLLYPVIPDKMIALRKVIGVEDLF